MEDRAASVLYGRLLEFAPDMFDLLLSLSESELDDSGRYVLSQAQMNVLTALVWKIIEGV